MPSYLRKFGPDDLFNNTLAAAPETEFVLYSGSALLNSRKYLGRNTPSGNLSLYELNVDRIQVHDSSSFIYAYSVKDGSFNSFKSIAKADYLAAPYGSDLTSSYPLTASIQREVIAAASLPSKAEASTDAFFDTRKKMIALGNTLNNYRSLSNSYAYTGSMLTGAVNMLSLPGIFYGSSIKKGSISLKFYYTGSLMDEAIDDRQNGQLISTMGQTSGTVVGVALYSEGFLLLTSSQTIYPGNYDDYTESGDQSLASWQYFGAHSSSNSQRYPSASLSSVSYKGQTNIPTMTMFAHAPSGELNTSQNPTWISSSEVLWRDNTATTSGSFIEPPNLKIKNTIDSEYCNFDARFEKQVFISKVGIFDKNKNLIGVAKLANPVRKKESDSYTFKLKLDM